MTNDENKYANKKNKKRKILRARKQTPKEKVTLSERERDRD